MKQSPVVNRYICDMSTAELKYSIIELISKINDENKLKTILSDLTSSKTDWWDVISDAEKRSIDKGISELNNGEGISHQVVREEIDQLLGRK